MKIKVGVIGTHGLPANYSGWETLVKNLYKYSKNVDYLIATPSKRKTEQNTNQKKSSVYVPLNASGWQSVFYDLFSMLRIIPKVDVILVLGVSGCIFLPFIKLITRKNIIVNTDGIEYKRKKWGVFASMFLKISEKFAVRFSDKIVADNIGIQEYLELEYNIKVDAVIEYGGSTSGFKKNEYYKKYPFKLDQFDLAIARIVPENNIEIILNTYKNLDQKLVFIGNWNSSNFGRKLLKKNWSSNIHLYDPDFDEKRLNSLRSSCRLYIHGHSAGGTNPSLVEAISLGCTIASYDINFNKYVLKNFGYYWKNSIQLTSILKNLKKIDSDKMINYYNKNFDWKIIASKYEDFFLIK